MHIEEAMQKAVNGFDWPAVQRWLSTIGADELRDRAQTLIDVILRDGYLILRYPDERRRARRDDFVDNLRAFLQSHGMQDLLDDRAGQFAGQAHTETAYHEILETFNNRLQARLSAAELAWAALRVPEKSFRRAWNRMFSTPSDPEHMFDPVTVKLPVDQQGSMAHPDDIMNGLQRTLAATLKMLAFRNGWFGEDGTLVIPALVPTTEEHERLAAGNVYLASIWHQIERSDGRCRYFGGAVTREEISLQEDDGTIRTGDTIKFTFDEGGEIALHIAGERLRRMLFGYEVELHRDRQAASLVVAAPPVPQAPQAYVSLEEMHGALALSRLFFTPVFEINREFAGLTLAQWLRGYAVIRKLAASHMEGPASPDGIVLVTEAALIATFADHGLPEMKAKKFLEYTCFARRSEDVFDAPFIRCEDGRLCFVVAGAAMLHLAFAVMSQLCSLDCDVSWKGQPFEESVIELLREHGVDAAGIKRHVNGKELQIDCVAQWGDVLFVFEDKNYSLPGDNARPEYWFLRDQADAARQVAQKVQAIQAYPDLVKEALGKDVAWSRIVPVVLNGIPFCLPGAVQGVYFYDASALRRFFVDGYVSVSVGREVRDEPLHIPATITRLWSGDRPRPEDLIRQLEQPVQLMHAVPFWTRRWQAFPLSERLNAATLILERLPTTPSLVARAIGIDQAALTASMAETTRRLSESIQAGRET